MNSQLIDAMKLLGTYTAGNFDFWVLAGPSKASCRAHVMSVLYARKVPQKKAGVTSMKESFFCAAFNNDAPGFSAAGCLAQREEAFQNWARSIVSQA